METVVIDDDIVLPENELPSAHDSDVELSECVNNYPSILKEHRQFGELLDFLILIGDSEMPIILKNTLIPLFNNADKTYVQSKSFYNVVKTYRQKFEMDPCRKYSCIKQMCETLKLYKKKKRVSFTTLSTTLSGKSNKGIGKKTCQRKTEDIINLDDPTDTAVPVINIDDADDQQSDVEFVNEEHKENTSNSNILNQSNTVNNTTEDTQNKLKRSKGKANKQSPRKKSKPNKQLTSTEMIYKNSSNTDINKNSTECRNKSCNEQNIINLDSEDYTPDIILVPTQTVSCNETGNGTDSSQPLTNDLEEELSLDRTLQDIETEIAVHKGFIEQLENQEVCTDDNSSPYIKVEYHKAKVVKLYKEICNLTGCSPVKRRSVRLSVTQGKHPGPARRLENFLNSKIESDGNPPFPNFNEVLRCVTESSVLDGLGWSKADIMVNAAALFKQCGEALQKRRQRREYKDLLGLIKTEITDDDDPANNDPELMAKLELNKQMAVKKESELLNRFASQPVRKNSAIVPQISLMEDESTEETRDIQQPPVEIELVPKNYDVQNQQEVQNENLQNERQLSNDDGYNETIVSSSVKNEPPDISGMLEIELTPINMDENRVEPQMSADSTHEKEIEPQLFQNQLNQSSLVTIKKEINDDTNIDQQIGNNINKNENIDISNQKVQRNDSANKIREKDAIAQFNQNKSNETVSSHVNNEIISSNNNLGLETDASNINVNNDTNINETTSEVNNINKEINDTPLDIVIKKEKQEKAIEDLTKELEELGDNYSVTILDIEDPFLVIEISSDSSDGENED